MAYPVKKEEKKDCKNVIRKQNKNPEKLPQKNRSDENHALRCTQNCEKNGGKRKKSIFVHAFWMRTFLDAHTSAMDVIILDVKTQNNCLASQNGCLFLEHIKTSDIRL